MIKDNNELSEREQAVECIKALSRIEGYTMTLKDTDKTEVLHNNIDYIMKYFDRILSELHQ